MIRFLVVTLVAFAVGIGIFVFVKPPFEKCCVVEKCKEPCKDKCDCKDFCPCDEK